VHLELFFSLGVGKLKHPESLVHRYSVMDDQRRK